MVAENDSNTPADISTFETAIFHASRNTWLYDQTLHLPKDGGVDTADVTKKAQACSTRLAALQAARRNGQARFMAWFDVGAEPADLTALAERYRRTFRDVVILGTGGAVLGGATLLPMRPAKHDGPRIHILENPDPDQVDALLRALTPEDTGVLAVSKSGSTTETLVLLAHFIEFFQNSSNIGLLAEHVAVMTQPRNSPLGRIAERNGLPRLEHDEDLAGRFSVAQTGLLPAILAGVDTEQLRTGGRAVMDAVLNGDDPQHTPPVIGAAVHVAVAEQYGVSQTVVMPYAESLKPFARWFSQLWAESLGKETRGITPIPALGPSDQHSQLQLYCDGAKDKLITLIYECNQRTAGLNTKISDPDLAVYGSWAMGEVMRGEALATRDALTEAGCPVRCLSLPKIDAYGLGALFMHYMLETVVTADLLNIDPFGQPAVDRAKKIPRIYKS